MTHDDFSRWMPLLALNQDALSQRLAAHAMAQGWGLRGLAWTLELLDDELCDAWLCGSGLADLPRRHIEIAADVLGLGVWQAYFLSGELSLSSFLSDELRSDLIRQAREALAGTDQLSGEVALLALVLAGHPLTSEEVWLKLVEVPPFSA